VKIPHIHIKNAALAYGGHLVFSHLDIDLPAGEWIALLGPSGVGKSSFLRMIAGLASPEETSQGTFYADNHQPLSQQVAYMGQTDMLLPWLTVLENAMVSARLGTGKTRWTEAAQQAASLLNKVGLAEASHLYPHQLSGGMRQRVALVRTLMQDKPLVLMDEPFSAVDAITRYKLQTLAAQLLQDKTVLFITHDPLEALRLADTIYIMQGEPASLKRVARLTSLRPRELSEPEIIDLQAMLFRELAQAAGEAL